MAAAGDLSDEERRALRGSKFAPLPPPPRSSRPQPRMAHPGGPLTTNKAAALAKFLERKLQQPDGLDSLNPDLVKLAVKNAKETIKASKAFDNSGLFNTFNRRLMTHKKYYDEGYLLFLDHNSKHNVPEILEIRLDGEPSTSGRVVRHVSSFGDGSEDSEDEAVGNGIKRKRKNKPQKPKAYEDVELSKKKKKKKNKKKKKKCKGC